MADSNVRDEFYEAPMGVNKTAVGAHVQTYFPLTSNIINGVASGQVVFEINTGSGEYLDLKKSHLRLEYTTDAVAATSSYGDCPLSNMFSRGQLYVNGKKVAASQNWTQDAILSKRISHSKAYNNSVNRITYNNVAAALPVFTDGPVVAVINTRYIDDEYLDALFLQHDGAIIPPNCSVRLLVDVDTAYALKSGLLNCAAAVAPGMVINTLKFISYTVVKPGPPPPEYVLSLITLNSFLSTITGANENRQYQVSPTIVKAAVASQDLGFATVLNPKLAAGNLLQYLGDNNPIAPGVGMTGLDFKLNNIVIPNSRWDFTYGYRDAYLNYIAESGGLSNDAAKETQQEWERYGKIHLCNIVKPDGDKSNSLQINASFAAAPLANTRLFVTSFEENAVVFTYDATSGALIDTQTMI